MHSRAGNGPGFLIANCYRYYGHGRKDPSPYRDKEEEAEWKKKDPVEAQKKRLIADGSSRRAGALQAMTAEVTKEMERRWRGRPSGAHARSRRSLFTDVYAD